MNQLLVHVVTGIILQATKKAMERGEQVDSDIDHRLAKGVDQSDAKAVLEAQFERLRTGSWMCEYFDKTTELCRRLTEFAMEGTDETKGQRFQICTGGGPGFMEAVSEGTHIFIIYRVTYKLYTMSRLTEGLLWYLGQLTLG